MCHDDLPRVLERLREVTDEYGEVFTVAEVGSPEPLPYMKDYTHGARRLNSAYGFEFLTTFELTAERVAEVLSGWPGEPGEGWPSWAFSNHDAMRVASRWLPDIDHDRRVRLIAVLQFALRGNVFVYQGEELGLEQVEVPFEKLKDPEAIANWPHTFGRDGARTPMPWAQNGNFAGFSTHEPWLPVGDAHLPLAVDVQTRDPDSMLSFFRELIALRKSSRALIAGDLELLDAPAGIVAMRRSSRGERAYCVVNLTSRDIDWAPDESVSIRAGVGVPVGEVPGTLPGSTGYLGISSND